jgi:hypothetical protein
MTNSSHRSGATEGTCMLAYIHTYIYVTFFPQSSWTVSKKKKNRIFFLRPRPAAYRRSSELMSVTQTSHKMSHIYNTFSRNFSTITKAEMLNQSRNFMDKGCAYSQIDVTWRITFLVQEKLTLTVHQNIKISFSLSQ